MKSFDNKIAVITGGGSGMGQALVQQLAEQGCHVAFCDLSTEQTEETLQLCREATDRGVRVTAHICDVASEADLERFRQEVADQHSTAHINLLFNNAGVSGGQSFIKDDRAQWERTFAICWDGVYLGCRVFMPMLLASEEGHIINTSSVNGFWACLGSGTEHTAYSSAKFAVKGFSEALLVDLRLNAPHVGLSVVMPGHIGTGIAFNTQKMWLGEADTPDPEAAERVRQRLTRIVPGAAQLSDEEVRAVVFSGAEDFRHNAPTTSAQAAEIILDGVRANRWRILVGDDAQALDNQVRNDPESAYEPDFNPPFSIMQNDDGDAAA